jgi:Mg-chelatase subunit ChlD
VSSSLRIARTEPGRLKPLVPDITARHARLRDLIRRHLPGVTASLLAEPRRREGGAVDWYSDLSGQPQALGSLPVEQQTEARKLLRDRLNSLAKLADEVPRIAPDSADLLPALRAAAQYPGDEHLYLVDGQPVLTFWGHLPPRAARAYARGAAAGRSRSLLSGTALLLVLLAVASGAWLWLDHQRETELKRELESALDAALTDQCGSPEPLDALTERLLALDPVEARYPEIWRRLKAERERCAAAMRFAASLEAAGGDCAALAVLRRESESLAMGQPPFQELDRRLGAELAVCAAAAGLDRRVTAALGDCDALAAIDRELGTPPGDAPPMLRVRARLDGELALCALAAALAQELDQARGDCPRLHRLDGRLAQEDGAHPGLAPVRAELDLELALCAKAEDYARRLAEVQTDCDALQALDADMQAEEVSREPLARVRARLDELLEQCRSLDDLEQALENARGDCAKLALLEKRLEGEGPRNPFFFSVKKKLLEEQAFCELAADLQQALNAAAGDCAALAALKPRFDAVPAADARFKPLRSVWNQSLAGCSLAETLERKLAEAGSDCGRLAGLKTEMDAAPRETPRRNALMKRFEEVWSACKRAAPAAVAEAKPQPQSGTPSREKKPTGKKRKKIRCPGERTKDEAPDLVLVFDASASMDRPISGAGAVDAVRQGLQMGGIAGAALGVLIDQAARSAGGPRRINVAKEAAGRIVQSLPNDVDVGLVLVEDCPSARPVGFFSPGQRRSLIRGINGIHPVSGTPLASGILRAANMVDGVNAPAVMVILSDGKESCNQDPCVAAHRVARRKPLLTINVVDITGTGAGNCAARATGGKVYTAKNAAQVKSMMQRATQAVRGPAECYRK